MNSTALVECPKCSGVGNFRNWRHIANGDCFLCGSAKEVTLACAGRWLASQVDRAPRSQGEPVERVDDGLKRRTVDVSGLGLCRMVRYEDGEIRVDFDGLGWRDEYDHRQVGGMWLVISVKDGRVKTARDSEDGRRLGCNGILGGTGELERHVLECLQRAIKT